MFAKHYASKVTPILIDLAISNKRDYFISEDDSDAGYIITAKGRRHFFTYGTLDINTNGATEFANSKMLSSIIANESGIRTPYESVLKYSAEKHIDIYFIDAKALIKSMKFPVFLKPMHGRQGKNIFKVDSYDGLKFAIESILSDKDDVLIQEYIDADEIRVVVLDGEIIQAYKRDFSHVIGDGLKTVRELIGDKNTYFLKRKRNTKIDIYDSQINSILREKGYSIDTIISDGERLNLSYGRNLSRGGNCEFIEHKLNNNFRSIIKEFADATGLRLVGFDLFVLSQLELITKKEQLILIEYNASPDMENNFYYDDKYDYVLHEIYEKIFAALVA